VLKTLQIKLLPNEQQKDALRETFIKFNQACNFVSKTAFERKLFNKVFLQRIVYKDIREKFCLSAQLAVRVIAKVVDTYKQDRTTIHHFRDFGSIVYDQRILSFKCKRPLKIDHFRPSKIDQNRSLKIDHPLFHEEGRVRCWFRRNGI